MVAVINKRMKINLGCKGVYLAHRSPGRYLKQAPGCSVVRKRDTLDLKSQD